MNSLQVSSFGLQVSRNMPIQSLHLNENEQVLLVLHRHWFVLARELASIVFFALFGIAMFFAKDSLYTFVTQLILDSLVWFLFSLYILVVLLLTFAVWINYRLDVWVITTRRIIDVEQRGLFNREISEFLLERVQDVTSEIPSMIATFLDFGTMTIHTAGEKNFLVRDIPRIEDAKRLILEYSQKAQNSLVTRN